MTNNQFISMPASEHGYKHPNALHVLLYSPNLPLHYIVFDGEKYWMIFPTPNHQQFGWGYRKEFKGAVDYLRVLPAYHALGLKLPFAVRDIDLAHSDLHWFEYKNLFKNK